jgi:radical SAM protein with 4Fe4S-binding SPASM domain
MKLVERKITAVITKEEEKAFETVHKVVSSICNKIKDCDNCPIREICGASWEPKEDIAYLLTMLDVEGD